MISLSDRNRRPHIGLKPRRYKKIPYVPPSDEPKEGEEGEFLISDSQALQAITSKIHDEKNEREERNKIQIEDDFYLRARGTEKQNKKGASIVIFRIMRLSTSMTLQALRALR